MCCCSSCSFCCCCVIISDLSGVQQKPGLAGKAAEKKRAATVAPPKTRLAELELVFDELALEGFQELTGKELVNSVGLYARRFQPELLAVSPIPHPSVVEYFTECVRGTGFTILPYKSSKAYVDDSAIRKLYFDFIIFIFYIYS